MTRQHRTAWVAIAVTAALASCGGGSTGAVFIEGVASVDAVSDAWLDPDASGAHLSDGHADDATSLDTTADFDAPIQVDTVSHVDLVLQADSVSKPDSTGDAGQTDALAALDAGPAATSFKVPPGVTTMVLGEFSHKQGDKVIGPLSVKIPADAISFTLSFDGTHGITYGVDALQGPGGKKLVKTGWVNKSENVGGQMCLSCKLRVTTMLSAAGALLPNAPDLSVAAGTYTFSVLALKRTLITNYQPLAISYPPGKVRVTVAIKHAVKSAAATQGLPLVGALDLNFYFTGSNGLTAASAPKHTAFLGWIATLKTTYQQVGLSIGQVHYHDLDAGYQVIEGAVGFDKGDFEEVAALTKQSAWGVNLVFVREIASPYGGAVLGISGGAPGPVAVQGTGRSVVIVTTESNVGPGIVPDIGLVMAHELGHYLGLFHNSENNFGGFQPAIDDPLSDTPSNDNNNLMYFNGATKGASLSAQQGVVMRGNPWVRHGGQP